jgi:hypothetical protein
VLLGLAASAGGVAAVAGHDIRIDAGGSLASPAAAALFNPLRRWVQRVVDRRFNRARYGAEAVVTAFTGRLRQTVDLDIVRDDLVDTVHQAFQPAHVSMWLPVDSSSRG